MRWTTGSGIETRCIVSGRKSLGSADVEPWPMAAVFGEATWFGGSHMAVHAKGGEALVAAHIGPGI